LYAKIDCKMKQIIPENLKPGDTIGIVATARWITHEQLEPALNIIRGWGFKVKCGKHVHKQVFQLAGSDEERTEDLQSMLDDDSVKAILIARGGYGTVRIVDSLDFTNFNRQPKWICGYSDITVLHDLLNNLGYATLHSTMPISFPENPPEVLESLKLSLMGHTPRVEFNNDWILNSPSHAFRLSGRLIGGNLSVLCSLLGRSHNYNFTNSIIFLEDIDEHLYHVDRMLMALKRAGRFDGLKAIIVGAMTDMKDNTKTFAFATNNPWGKSIAQIFSEIAGSVNIPIISGVPAGHMAHNKTLRMGVDAEISVNGRAVVISF